METYIALLRGINVSGHRIIKMEALRELAHSLGFTHVRTYLQSGNLVFCAAEASAPSLAQTLSSAIDRTFGFPVQVKAFSIAEFKAIIDRNPHSNEENDQRFLHVTFLFASPKHVDEEKIANKKSTNELWHHHQDVIYLYCPGGYGRTKLSNPFFEKLLQVGATTRNWKSVNEIYRIARDTADTV